MKGPYERLKYDLRRVWECPVCKRRERAAGSVTFKHCLCQMQQLDGKPVVMKLVEDGVQRISPLVVIEHERVEVAPAAEEDEDSGFGVQGSGEAENPAPEADTPQPSGN
jgi:hypothetical protein